MKKIGAILVTANPSLGRRDDGAMVKVDGREAALRAIELVTNRDPIVQTILVVDSAAADEIKRKIGSHLMFMGTKLAVTDGGWYAQLKAGAAKLADDVTHVLVHDAARPAVPYPDLEALISSDAPATALALPLRGTLVRAAAVPGLGSVDFIQAAILLAPRLYDRSTFESVCATGAEPSPLSLIEGSPLNVRCGDVPAAVVKAMVQLLPKPKVAPTNPFEEAQW